MSAFAESRVAPAHEEATVSAAEMAARLTGVSKHYGDHVAVRDVNLRIARGAITALLGPNGAGKTTIVRLLLGLAAPTLGTVSVFGSDPRRPVARARIGAMLQVAKVPETLRVREHIEVFRSYFPAPLAYSAVIAAARLEGLDRRLFGTLSGGERQRVLFALALCGNPDLLVLDEPTVGLDVEARRDLWTCIRRLSEERRAVLLTTHYLEEADALAHRVVVINRGDIVADGTPAEIKSTVALRRIRCVTSLSLDAVRTIAAGDVVRRDAEITEVLTTNVESVVREMLIRDPSLTGLEVAGAGLEEAFLAITRGADDAIRAASLEKAVA